MPNTFILNFTTRVLGNKASTRLKQHLVTQTIRSLKSGIVEAYQTGQVKVGDLIEIHLNDQLVGVAELLSVDQGTAEKLTVEDAKMGGFDTRFELLSALKRAGYRFMPLDMYIFYRCRFAWGGN